MTPELRDWYRGRRVFVTGHTGFKGAWLVAWLRDAGAEVTGYALSPEPDRPALFEVARIGQGMRSIFADIRNLQELEHSLVAAAPEVVFHLAAQSLVRRSYRKPVETFGTNVLGTVHVLDAARRVPSIRAIVVVTSDKCYANHGAGEPCREDDPLGGRDAYSSSKACAELVTSAFRSSFLRDQGVAVASARAGNVIGGGDWAEDRLLPDLMLAASMGETALIRNPGAVRPWQYVLEPLRGYLMLGRALVERGESFAEAWNFGPREKEIVTVAELANRLRLNWDRVVVDCAPDPAGPHEAAFLSLDCSKARDRLGWEPALSLEEGIDMTVTWYRSYYNDPTSAATMVQEQLGEYEARAQLVERRR